MFERSTEGRGVCGVGLHADVAGVCLTTLTAVRERGL